MGMPSETEMLRAIAQRNPAMDGRFVFGVVTTGVYCRPSCPARAANPENIRFFPDADRAESAGFRACKRCRPQENATGESGIVAVARYIDEHADEKLTLKDLAAVAGVSPSHLQRRFKASVGLSPKAYQQAARLRSLKSSLRDGDDVTGAIFSAGFGSTSRVYDNAARNIGMTPGQYRAGGAGETIYFATRRSALGPMMMAATGRGVCFVQFDSSADALLGKLEREFPNATLIPSPAASSDALGEWIRALDEHISENAPRPELPLDLRGTAFQLRVWQFLIGIPQGKVVSYGEVADGIGKPTAARAAASACARNRVAVLVPCHRVLRGDGGLGGYRWGEERKRTLLDRERSADERGGEV